MKISLLNIYKKLCGLFIPEIMNNEDAETFFMNVQFGINWIPETYHFWVSICRSFDGNNMSDNNLYKEQCVQGNHTSWSYSRHCSAKQIRVFAALKDKGPRSFYKRKWLGFCYILKIFCIYLLVRVPTLQEELNWPTS